VIRHFITSEYPPQEGGVSDYTELVATKLAVAGDEVHVWCPPFGILDPNLADSEIAKVPGVVVHRDLGSFGPADLYRAGRLLNQFPRPRHLLVQWVPHGYGYRSMNLPFCFWLWFRAKLRGDHLELMVHEPFLAFGEGSKRQDLAAAVHRLMVTFLLSASSRVWVSIPEWEMLLRPFTVKRKSITWLPVPGTIAVVDDAAGVAKVRDQYSSPGGTLVGHFGTYNRYMIELMERLLPALLTSKPALSVLLLGKGSLELRERVIARDSDLANSLHATGALAAGDVSRHISACDVMLQPYQDGISGRRTSAMTALSHGIPLVTTRGKATEGTWSDSHAVVLTEVEDVNAMVAAVGHLLADDELREQMRKSGVRLYRDRFDVRHTISALCGHAPVDPAGTERAFAQKVDPIWNDAVSTGSADAFVGNEQEARKS
jgi:glycosyltransferase involved in cell wall biosynthesis